MVWCIAKAERLLDAARLGHGPRVREGDNKGEYFMIIDRRSILTGSAALTIVGCAPKAPPMRVATTNAELAALEAKSGGRLGAFILDTATGKMTGHRFGERFGLCSTFKMGLAAAVLQLGDKGLLDLDTVIPYTKADLIANSPVTTDNVGKGGMTILAMAEAMQKTSDNAAANLVMRKLGGPAELTKIFRDWGDTVTRFDRYEPEMNNVPAGEVRDTTTPQAFAQVTAKLLTTDLLSPQSRDRLIQWMIDTKTGSERIRKGLPPSWRAGNKTGTGWGSNYDNKTNDVAIFWPPARPPVIVTAYYEADGKYDEVRDADQAVLAEVGRIAAAQVVEWHKRLD